MKNPTAILSDIKRRLERTWADDLTDTATSWPHRFPLGTAAKSELERGWQGTYQPLIAEWRQWAREHPVHLHTEPKRVYTTTQDVPTHVEVADIESAAALTGSNWPVRLTRARARLSEITSRFPHTPDMPRTLRAIEVYSDIDFALLLTTAAWFEHNDALGYTPRQVPIPGLHAKWLNTHQSQILALSRRKSLELLPRHPSRIHFTYLDPAHRAAGGRIHDSATVGDSFTPSYRPTTVVISENKDTAIHFPPIPGAIAVEGEGFGGKTAAAFPWVSGAASLYYWGDIDAHGFEILNGWRADGVPATSLLMDIATYRRYEPYGTNTDRHGVLLQPGTPKPLPHLTTEEIRVYQCLLDPALATHRRIEQERIPLEAALEAMGQRRAQVTSN